MAEEDVPNDLDVRLEWPEVEGPPISKRPQRASQRGAAPSAPEPAAQAGALVPQRRAPGGFPDELLGRLETLTRAVRGLQADKSVQDLSSRFETRVDDLARAMDETRKAASKRSAAQAQRTGDQLKGLARRVDSLARAVEAIPDGTELAALLGRVDALAGAVETLCSQVGQSADRLDSLREEIASSFVPLVDATDEVRSLNDTVTSTLLARTERQVELTSQIDALAKEIRSLRRRVPLNRSAEFKGVVDAVSDAVREALANGAPDEATPKRTRARKSASRASTAPT